ncbi:MAG: YCF48-related protein [Candidatus Korobacteraceae bacterium]
MNRGIPKSVGDALASPRPAEEHPSSDLLNGYVEHSLSAAEKAGVAMHLAACEECREVVFLSSGATEEPSVTAIAEPARVWHGWKWAVPAAALLALASSILVEHRERLAPVRQAATQTSSNQANPVMSPGVATSSVAERDHLPPKPASNAALAAKLNPPGYQRATTGGGKKTFSSDQIASAGAVAGTSSQNRDELAAFSNPAPTTVPPPQAAVPHNATATSSAGAVAPSPLQTAVAQQPPIAHTFGALGRSGFQSLNKSAASPGLGGAIHVSIAPPAHWRITADGHLERSAAADTWTRVLADRPVVFRAVAVVLNDIWTGGDNGALFHSIDGGNNWSQVVLSADGRPETSAVVSIQFDDVWHGSVATQAGSRWTTSDRGQTWTKQ